MSALPMLPEDCRKFQTCNASICPLDPRWRSAVHLHGEKCCPYLVGLRKAGAEEHFEGHPEFVAVKAVADEVIATFPEIARVVDGAARTGFRGAHLKSKRVAKDGPEASQDGPEAGQDPTSAYHQLGQPPEGDPGPTQTD